MQASKTPAYIALIAAVAAGALLSPHRNDTIAPSLPAAATSTPEKTPPEPILDQSVAWQDSELVWGNVRLRINAPLMAGKGPDCHTPVGDELEVGTCVGVVSGDSPIVWKVSTVSQRDRFVPVSWFTEAKKDVRQSVPPDQLAARLKADGALSSSISLDNPVVLATAPLKDEIAIAGQAMYRPSQNVPPVVMTCVLAYILVANRPTQIFYCTTGQDVAVADAARLIGSIRKMNPSAELPRGSIQAIERTTYQKRLRNGGGAASNPALVNEEIQYFATTRSDCHSYGVISQERFTCYEQHAKARIDQMSAASDG